MCVYSLFWIIKDYWSIRASNSSDSFSTAIKPLKPLIACISKQEVSNEKVNSK